MTKRQIIDPDLGLIAVPPPPEREASEALVEDQRRAFAARSRLWPDGAVAECPSCGRKAFVGRNDLSHEVARPAGVVVFRHLHGAKCSHCGAQSLEPWELMQIDDEVGPGQVGDYEAKVSNIGTGTVGTYWPKDVVRVMNLRPDTRVFIQILDRETALVRFVRGRGGASRRGTRRKSAR